MPLPAGADRLPLVPPNLHLSAGKAPAGGSSSSREKSYFHNVRSHIAADKGGVMEPISKEIRRGLQGQFYCGKCLLIISGE